MLRLREKNVARTRGRTSKCRRRKLNRSAAALCTEREITAESHRKPPGIGTGVDQFFTERDLDGIMDAEQKR
jgi:hypothetical protein